MSVVELFCALYVMLYYSSNQSSDLIDLRSLFKTILSSKSGACVSVGFLPSVSVFELKLS